MLPQACPAQIELISPGQLSLSVQYSVPMFCGRDARWWITAISRPSAWSSCDR